MSTTHVISALRDKRAELAGDVLATQKRLEKLRDDLDAVDRTLRIFDPNRSPDSIRPVVKRKGDKLFAYGECMRAIMNTLRVATEPMTAEQIAEQVALDCRLGTESPDIAATLLARVKQAMVKMRARGLAIGEGKPTRWALAS
jgi:hypothetical protein